MTDGHGRAFRFAVSTALTFATFATLGVVGNADRSLQLVQLEDSPRYRTPASRCAGVRAGESVPAEEPEEPRTRGTGRE